MWVFSLKASVYLCQDQASVFSFQAPHAFLVRFQDPTSTMQLLRDFIREALQSNNNSVSARPVEISNNELIDKLIAFSGR